MSAPDPRRVQVVVNRTKVYLDEFAAGYARRYGEVYGPQGHGLGRSGPVHESRPTELAAARARLHSQRLVAWGKSLIAIHQVAQGLARGTRPRVQVPDTGSLDRFPPLISPDEHAVLVEARTRRAARGEE